MLSYKLSFSVFTFFGLGGIPTHTHKHTPVKYTEACQRQPLVQCHRSREVKGVIYFGGRTGGRLIPPELCQATVELTINYKVLYVLYKGGG